MSGCCLFDVVVRDVDHHLNLTLVSGVKRLQKSSLTENINNFCINASKGFLSLTAGVFLMGSFCTLSSYSGPSFTLNISRHFLTHFEISINPICYIAQFIYFFVTLGLSSVDFLTRESA